MLTLLLGVVVFVLTSIETWVGNRHTSARLLARKYKTRALRLRSAAYAATFEGILVVWIVLGLENWHLMLLAIPGAWVGDWIDTGLRRKKRKKVADPQVLM